MLLHDAQRLVAILGDLRIAIGAEKTPKNAEADHFFIIHDENAGSVVHVITSQCCLTINNAMNMPEKVRLDF
jgi:hypothetical protein